MMKMDICRLALVGLLGLVAAGCADAPDDAGRLQQALEPCASSCDCANHGICRDGYCHADFGPFPQCRESCDCSGGQVCSGGFCCASNVGNDCYYIGGPYQGCSQYMSYWCTAPGQSMWGYYYVGPNDPLCGAGNSEYGVYCIMPGKIQCNGSCQ